MGTQPLKIQGEKKQEFLGQVFKRPGEGILNGGERKQSSRRGAQTLQKPLEEGGEK